MTFQHAESPYTDYDILAPHLELGVQISRNCTVLNISFRTDNYHAAGSRTNGGNATMEWRSVQNVPSHNGKDKG
jgi:hypothetical protein